MVKNIIQFKKTNNKIDQQKGYIIYYQEIKTSKGIVKLEIKILKTDVNNLQKQLIKKPIPMHHICTTVSSMYMFCMLYVLLFFKS